MTKEDTQRIDARGWVAKVLGWFAREVFIVVKQIKDVAVYSSLHIAGIAIIETSIATVLLGVHANLSLAIIGLVTFAVYANDRIADVETDAYSSPKQAAFVRRHQNLLYLSAAVAYGVAVMLAVTSGPIALAITLLPGAFWILYATSWLEGVSQTVHRCKEIIIINTGLVALAWSVTITFLPIAVVSGFAPPETGLVFVYLFCRDYVHTEVPNIPDRGGDAKIGVDTIPSKYGLITTRQVLYLLNTFTVGLVAFAAFREYFNTALISGLILGLGYSFVVIALIGRWDRDEIIARLVEYEYPLTLATISIFSFT